MKVHQLEEVLDYYFCYLNCSCLLLQHSEHHFVIVSKRFSKYYLLINIIYTFKNYITFLDKV